MRRSLFLCGLVAAVSLVYANHFVNGFHFDDSHAVVENPYIRSLRNVPLFFTDARTFSVLPANRTWRPLVSVSLALDYWLGGGLKPVWFQASTFIWFLVQLVLMYWLFLRICDLARPDPWNRWIALAAAAWYGLHPAIAETVNYIIQRGEVFSTLGVVGGLLLYAARPDLRKYGLYLLPVIAALLSKPPALVFPAILFVYVRLFEESNLTGTIKRCRLSIVPSVIFAALYGIATPRTFVAGAPSAFDYWRTQPLVALRYFRNFFLPDQLSADTDHTAVSGLFQGYAWLGILFVAAVITAAISSARIRQSRPAAFGLWWFLLALLPTSVFPLAEVENDHRMFFPFVGLALAVTWTFTSWLRDWARSTWRNRIAAASLVLTLFAAYATATVRRNQVWRTDESLWSDVTLKSPRNGRGLMNYGLTLMARGDAHGALGCFERALAYNPAYHVLEVNLGVANGLLDRDVEAEQHFQCALRLAPVQAVSHYFYARWLRQRSRLTEAAAHLEQAIAANPDHLDSRYLLMDIRSQQLDWARLKGTAIATLNRFPADPAASRYLVNAATAPAVNAEAQKYVNESLASFRAGRFADAVEAARNALRIEPRFPEAYNNLAAAYAATGKWDEAIAAAKQALNLRPDFQLARNNLLWAEQHRAAAHLTATNRNAPRSD